MHCPWPVHHCGWCGNLMISELESGSRGLGPHPGNRLLSRVASTQSIGYFIKRTGTSIDDGARTTNTYLCADDDGARMSIWVFMVCALWSTDFPVLLLS